MKWPASPRLPHTARGERWSSHEKFCWYRCWHRLAATSENHRSTNGLAVRFESGQGTKLQSANRQKCCRGKRWVRNQPNQPS
jgi:hypothetical protein